MPQDGSASAVPDALFYPAKEPKKGVQAAFCGYSALS
jgi:hypothetical protein